MIQAWVVVQPVESKFQFKKMIKIAIAEDNELSMNLLLDKLSIYPALQPVLLASNGADLLQRMRQSGSVDMVLMDIEMPVMDGITATAMVKQEYPGVKVVIVTVYDDDASLFNAIRAGADGYILKEAGAAKIWEMVQDTMQGGAVMSPSIAMKTLQWLKELAPAPPAEHSSEKILTERETDILVQISKGYSNRKVAENLFISPYTVKRHIENIYQKLHTNNRIELIKIAKGKGLL